MQSEYTKAAVLGLWVLAVYVAVVASNVSSVSHWIGLASLAIVPPVIARALWHAPAQTMSESIQESIR
jgi:hypothetical protein